MTEESKVKRGLQAKIIPVLKCSHGARLVLLFAIFTSHVTFAQGSRTAIVHGHANDVAGVSFKKGSVKLYNYSDAISSYSKALNSRVSIKFRTELAAAAENNLGTALANSGKSEEAVAAFDAAAKYDPAKAGKYYLNEAVVLRNLNQEDLAFIAAGKVIAADPGAAEAYYIRAQALVGRAVEDPVTHKLAAPPECVEAYRKYLELEPGGKYAPEIREILTALGQPIETSDKKRR
jgi:tetratricopeptide (TPR) repeat protein